MDIYNPAAKDVLQSYIIVIQSKWDCIIIIQLKLGFDYCLTMSSNRNGDQVIVIQSKWSLDYYHPIKMGLDYCHPIEMRSK